VQATIEDDGAGFPVEETLRKAPHLGSVGLAGMQERAALLGGRLEVSSTPGAGSRVTAIVPITAEDHP
jgi:signal transduction histidine kinase